MHLFHKAENWKPGLWLADPVKSYKDVRQICNRQMERRPESQMSQNRFVAFLEEFWSSVTEEKSSPKPSGNNTDQKTVLSILSKLLPCALSHFSLFYTHIRNSAYFQSLKKKIYGWFVFFLCCLWVGKPPAVCGVWIRPNGRCWMGFIFPSNYLIAASYYSFMFQQQHKN